MANPTPTVVDLFAGAGGLSLGAARAGFIVKAAVEIDGKAASTHELNFPKTEHIDSDINELSGETILSKIGMKKGELTGVIGGPPCQGFSVIGTQSKDDTRNDLFGHFFRLVSETEPSFFLAENVPGILNAKFDDIRDKAFAHVSEKYTLLDPIRVTASDYGAPTKRRRVFFFGYRKDKFAKEFNAEHFAADEKAENINVRTALQGLPKDIAEDGAGWRTVEKLNGTSFMAKVTGSVPEGVGDPDTLKQYELNKVSGCLGTKHLPKVIDRFEALEHGKRDKVSKSFKLDPEGLCPTLLAGTGSERGSYQSVRPIHYLRPRVITPREAARLQGFPDWFVFHPTKWHSFRQIGNSVSPLVGEYLLSQIKEQLK